jgi:CRP-like cAMP-binding protein
VRRRSVHPPLDGKLAVLSDLGLFADVPTCELTKLARTLDLSSNHPGQYLEVQGTPARWWTLIVTGHALEERDGTPIGLLTRGDSWSERTIVEHLPAPHSVVALTPVTVLTMKRSQFFGLPDRHPEPATALRSVI